MSAKPTVQLEEVEDWFEEEEAEATVSAVAEPQADPAEKYATSQLRVVRETKDYQLDYLRHALQPGRELIDTAPGYQRRLRWPNKKRSLLIESLLLNIPVPPVFLFEHDYNAYEVIDGRQRLETIRAFLSNDFALSGMEYWPELNRKRFNDLPAVLQRGLLRRSLSAVVLLAETKVVDGGIDIRRVLFDRLNTGGIKLNPQELRNALYPGAFNAMLIRLARSEPFTDAWAIPPRTANEDEDPSDELLNNPLYSSLADAELVLRFFALRDALNNDKSGALKRIMDRFMDQSQRLTEGEIAEFEAEYLLLLKRLSLVFGGEPFRLPKTNRPSRPLYDALMIALSRCPALDIESRAANIQAKLENALSSKSTYDVLVGRGNTLNSVNQRVDLACEILKA